MRGHELRKQVVLFLFIFFDEFFLTFVVEGNKLRDQPVTSPNNSKEKNPRLEKIKALVTPEEGVLMLFLMITWEFTKPEFEKSMWKYGKMFADLLNML